MTDAGDCGRRFEFEAPAGERPRPICAVAQELRSGRRFQMWQDEFSMAPPWARGPDVLFVSYFTSAELGCFRTLAWPMPDRVLDLFSEFRCLTNGLPKPAGSGLLGALAFFGVDSTGVVEKAEMQKALGDGTWGGRYSPDEILSYCASDVAAAKQLLAIIWQRLDLPRALLRGRYMATVAAMEHNGVPIDYETLTALRANWVGIKSRLIAEVDVHHVFEGQTFKYDRFAELLTKTGTPWPRLESGRLDLSDVTFRNQVLLHPWLAPLRELRTTLADLRLEDLAVSPTDHRNRTLLSPFRSKTGRNQPSNSKFIFGPSAWIRGLIKPPRGHGLAYMDWRGQEIAIAAALSGDVALQNAYKSGDVYLSFGRMAGIVPADATKNSHPLERELCKQCFLAIGYGQGELGLAQRIGQPRIVARDLMAAHRRTFKRFWAWSDAAVDHALLLGKLHTVFGWQLQVRGHPNSRSLRNFPAQANGAEMMRLAACLGVERGVQICAPIHDAFLICAPLERLEADVITMSSAMHEAGRLVLNGFDVDVEVAKTHYPNRYMDPRGEVMWTRVIGLLEQIRSAAA